MADLPHPWDLYARLQSSLWHERRVDDRSWGNEAGMTHILNSPAGCPPTQHEVKRVVATTRRRERYRDSRRTPMPEDVATPHPECGLHARHELATIQSNLDDRDWKLLTAAAIGFDYKEISRTRSTPQGALRVRVSRLRRELATLIGA
ncbi:MAG: hypothetical protein QOJ54_1896 [Aliidongia sp.]|jgi:hypothetical protein|nr:hypothetical protein [Aliidongia sp.]